MGRCQNSFLLHGLQAESGAYCPVPFLGVSKLTGESVSMTQALHDLGLACEASGDFESARIYHEENRDLAKKHNLSDTVILANTRLLHVYTTLASKYANTPCH